MFKEIKFDEIKNELLEKLKKDFALVTAGKENDLNTMTVSWGAFGELWHKDMATIYIRENRYTLKYLDKEDYFTITFYGKDYKNELLLCGTKSGKDIDKVKETGFTIFYDKAPYFKEASIVLICKKVSKTYFKDIEIYDENIINDNYNDNDYHYAYSGIIEKVLVKE